MLQHPDNYHFANQSQANAPKSRAIKVWILSLTSLHINSKGNNFYSFQQVLLWQHIRCLQMVLHTMNVFIKGSILIVLGFFFNKLFLFLVINYCFLISTLGLFKQSTHPLLQQILKNSMVMLINNMDAGTYLLKEMASTLQCSAVLHKKHILSCNWLSRELQESMGLNSLYFSIRYSLESELVLISSWLTYFQELNYFGLQLIFKVHILMISKRQDQYFYTMQKVHSYGH